MAAPYGSYGAAGGFVADAGPKEADLAALKGKKKPGPGLMCAAFVLPVLVFAAFFSMESFKSHYTNPGLTSQLGFLGAVLVLVPLVLAVQQVRSNGPNAVAAWYGLLTASIALAVILSIVLGEINYEKNMRPYYDVDNLNEYPSIDLSQFTGNQLMDAGQIHFVEGTSVDTQFSMAFRNNDVYCIAPIVSPEGSADLDTFDFWAVGKNCCTGTSDKFHCEYYDDPKALSGLRLMNDDARAYYRLAVQQAEAAFNIEAKHPLFFHWLPNSQDQLDSFEEDGSLLFTVGTVSFIGFQLLLVVVAAVVTAKM